MFLPVYVLKAAVGLLCVLAFLECCLLICKKVNGPSECACNVIVARFALMLLGLVVICFGLMALPGIAERHGALMMLYTVAIVKFSDVGGFAFGLTSAKLMKGGNHKMCPTISPGKSWEGFVGSILLSSAVSCGFMGVTHFSVSKSVALGVVAAVIGTAGDLVESKFKRWVGVKDSSALKLTNGLGGFLDMFDSLLFAPAVLSCFY